MTRLVTAALLVFTVTLNISAQTNNPPAVAGPKSGPEAKKDAKKPAATDSVRKLSRREKRDAMAKLPEKYRVYLKEVEPIMMGSELDTFLLLESDAQRDVYIEQFWIRRDSDPRTARNEYREQYTDLLLEARTKFKNLSSERSRIFLTRGRPVAMLKIDCHALQPIEIWQYAYLPHMGSDILLLFFKPRIGGDYVLWGQFASGDNAVGDLLSADSIGVSPTAGDAVRRVFANGGISMGCMEGRTIMAAINQAQVNSMKLGGLFEPPKVEVEDIGKILRAAVIATPGATPLPAELTVNYPGKRGGRTAIEMNILIPADRLTPNVVSGSRFYNVDITGEVLKDGKMFESYRYRFDFPAETAGAQIPVSVERFLRPAEYMARIKVTDVNSTAEAILERPLQVPHVMDEPTRAEAKAEASVTVSQIQADIRSGVSTLRLIPLPEGILTGLRKIETLITGTGIAAVEFYLDGRKAMVKRNPPFSLDLDFGSVPQRRRVKAVALDSGGKVISGDELEFNIGSDPFRMRIVSPRVAVDVQGRLRVEMDAQIPDGKELDHVELYLNETRLATLYTPPFIQTIDVPENAGIGYLRAVAVLTDKDIQPVEDVVFINSPEFVQDVQVHLVELPTTVLDKNRPVVGLEQSAFRVLDEGKPVTISKFEYVKNLPLSVGLAVDTSGSMRDNMSEAQKAGAEFLKSMMKTGDKAFVVSFDAQPLLVQKWSRQLSDLNAALASMRAEESTALYDAVVFSLYQFQNIKGQKALILISDGKDTASDFTFEQTIEYAKRTGVPIYGIGLGIRGSEMDARGKLMRFAAETGGNTYFIDRAQELAATYQQIQDELRSQYLLSFYPPSDVQPGSKWREVTVEVRGARAKTIRGYYP